MRDTYHHIIKDANFDDIPKVIINTIKNQQAKEYFMRSIDEVKFFLEKNIFTQEDGFNCLKEKSVNKIGHALHSIVYTWIQTAYLQQ